MTHTSLSLFSSAIAAALSLVATLTLSSSVAMALPAQTPDNRFVCPRRSEDAAADARFSPVSDSMQLIYHSKADDSGKAVRCFYSERGWISIEIHMQDDVWHGIFASFRDNGHIESHVTFDKGSPRGTLFCYSPYGEMNAAYQLKDWKPHGFQILFSPSGVRTDFWQYREGRLDGISQTFYPDTGTLRESTRYAEGMLDGKREKFSSDGIRIGAGEFSKGCGVFVDYWPSGSIERESPYENGSLHGIVREYYEDGSLKSESPYENGYLHGTRRIYYQKGSHLMLEQPYVNGKLEGMMREYNDDGSLRSETPFSGFRQEGHQRIYRANGTLMWDKLWKNGKLDGPSVLMRRDDTPRLTVTYDAGTLTGGTCHGKDGTDSPLSEYDLRGMEAGYRTQCR